MPPMLPVGVGGSWSGLGVGWGGLVDRIASSHPYVKPFTLQIWMWSPPPTMLLLLRDSMNETVVAAM